MTNELTDVRCPCGAEFQADSYDAGFIAGSGMCQNCDAAMPPKDIPAPVEQAGGDERAAFEVWIHTFDLPPQLDGEIFADERYPEADCFGQFVYDDHSTQRCWAAWQARAALAQPEGGPVIGCLCGMPMTEGHHSPDGCCNLEEFAPQAQAEQAEGAQGERDGWGPLPIVQVPWNVFDRAVMWVEDRRRYGDDGTIVDDWKALKTIQRAALAQPSPVQAEGFPELLESVRQMDAMLKAKSVQADCIYCQGSKVVSTTDTDHNGDHIEMACPKCTEQAEAEAERRWCHVCNGRGVVDVKAQQRERAEIVKALREAGIEARD